MCELAAGFGCVMASMFQGGSTSDDGTEDRKRLDGAAANRGWCLDAYVRIIVRYLVRAVM